MRDGNNINVAGATVGDVNPIAGIATVAVPVVGGLVKGAIGNWWANKE